MRWLALALPLLALALVVPSARADGEPPDSALYREISAQDSALTEAFNHHELAELMALFTDDLEFFHDLGGLQHFGEVKAGFASLFKPGSDIQRELLPGTMQVYPVRGYGAIEVGRHRFCHTENAKPVCGTFAFTHVWRHTGEHWQISRVISYGH